MKRNNGGLAICMTGLTAGITTGLIAGIFTSCAYRPTRGPGATDPKPIIARNALWNQVKDFCLVPNQPNSRCVEVNLEKGYILFKDEKSPTHFLLVPSMPVTGIEDPLLLQTPAPNYWKAALRARPFLNAILKNNSPQKREITRESIGFAINPPYARSQDQLHIHVDCMKPQALADIRSHKDEITASFGDKEFKVDNTPYQILQIARSVNDSNHAISDSSVQNPEEELGDIDPFRVLSNQLADPSALGQHTLVLVAAEDGFYLLTRKANRNQKGALAHGEDLLDFKCIIANQK